MKAILVARRSSVSVTWTLTLGSLSLVPGGGPRPIIARSPPRGQSLRTTVAQSADARARKQKKRRALRTSRTGSQ